MDGNFHCSFQRYDIWKPVALKLTAAIETGGESWVRITAVDKEQYEVTGKKPDALLEDYAKQDKFGEYPVKGAVLKCNAFGT